MDIPFDSEPTDEGFGDAFMPVITSTGGIDFDYDSRNSTIYWTAPTSNSEEVREPKLSLSHFCLAGRVVKGMGYLGHDEATEAGGREFSLHGRVVKGVDTLATMKLWRREVVSSASMAEWLRAWDTLAMMKLRRREVVSLSPDPGTIVGRVFSPSRQLVRFSHPNNDFVSKF